MNRSKILCFVCVLVFFSSCKEVERVYYEDGTLRFEAQKKGDMLDGYYKRYHPNGNLEVETFFKDDKHNGIARYYNEEGRPTTVAEYKNDTLEGSLIIYYPNGQVKKDAIMQKDMVSYYKEYDIEGNLIDLYRFISIDLEEDTFYMGSQYKANIEVFGPPLTSQAHLTAILMNPKKSRSFAIADTIKLIDGKGVFFFSLDYDRENSINVMIHDTFPNYQIKEVEHVIDRSKESFEESDS